MGEGAKGGRHRGAAATLNAFVCMRPIVFKLDLSEAHSRSHYSHESRTNKDRHFTSMTGDFAEQPFREETGRRARIALRTYHACVHSEMMTPLSLSLFLSR